MEFKTLSSALVLNVLLAGQAAIAMDPTTEDPSSHPPVIQTEGIQASEDPRNSTPPPSAVQTEQEDQASENKLLPRDSALTKHELLLTSQVYSQEAEEAAKMAEKAAAPNATEEDKKAADVAANALIEKGLELKNNGKLSSVEINEEKAASWTSTIWKYLPWSKKGTASSASSSTPQETEPLKTESANASSAPQAAEPSKPSSSSSWSWLNPFSWGRSTAVVTEANGELIPLVVQNATTTTEMIGTTPSAETATTPAPAPEVTPQPEPAPAPTPVAEAAPPSTEATVQSQ